MKTLENKQESQRVNHSAFKLWQGIFYKARKALRQEKWNKAVYLYSAASDAAENLLRLKNPQGVNQYIRTNIEYIYALRKDKQDTNLNHIVAYFRTQLMHSTQCQSGGKPLGQLMTPFYDMSIASEEEIDHWVESIWALEESHSATKH